MSTENKTEIELGRSAKIKKLESRIEYLESVVKALLNGMKGIEDELDEEIMEEGEYFGISFK